VVYRPKKLLTFTSISLAGGKELSFEYFEDFPGLFEDLIVYICFFGLVETD